MVAGRRGKCTQSVPSVYMELRDEMALFSSVYQYNTVYQQTHEDEEQREYFITINSSPINFFRRIVYAVTAMQNHYGSLQSRPLQNRRYLLRYVCLLQEKIEHTLLAQNLLSMNSLLFLHMNIGKEDIDYFSSLHTSSIGRLDGSSYHHPTLLLRSKHFIRGRGNIGRVEQENVHLVLGFTQ